MGVRISRGTSNLMDSFFCLTGNRLWSREQDAAVLLGTGRERGS